MIFSELQSLEFGENEEEIQSKKNKKNKMNANVNESVPHFLQILNLFCFYSVNAAYSVLSVAYVNSHHLINRRSMIYCRIELFMVYGSSPQF